MACDIAFSPCPNDTHIFHAWVHGLVGHALPVNAVLADVQQLNEWAIQRKYALTKVSLGCLKLLLDDYILLPTGAALGFGCGPKIVAKRSFCLADFPAMSVAIPGKHTTANLLRQALLPEPAQILYCRYHEVLDLVQSGRVDCGLIIHETRFTYHKLGFLELADLGQMWETQKALPIPLGGIVALRSLGMPRLREISQTIRQSLLFARAHPQYASAYIEAHSQEKDPLVIRQHIDLYVNQESLQLSSKGRQSLQQLLGLPAADFGAAESPDGAHAWILEN